MQKFGGEAKKAMTWVGSKAHRQAEAAAAAAREVREARMKHAHHSKKSMKSTTTQLIGDPTVLETDTDILSHLATAMEPFKDDAWQRTCRHTLARVCVCV